MSQSNSIHGLLVGCIISLSIIAVLFSVYKYYYLQDYAVVVQVPCDPTLTRCFIGDEIPGPEIFKLVTKKAHAIPVCNAWADECQPLACAGESDCFEVTCDDESPGVCWDAAL